MSTTLKLYEIPAAFAALDARLEDAGGELTPELAAELDALEGTLEARAEALAALIQQHQLTADAFRAEALRLAAAQAAHANAAGRLRDYLRAHLEVMGRPRLDAGAFRLRVRANPAAIRWEGDPEAIPGPYRRVRYELDSEAARRDLAAGTLPPSFSVTRGSHLRIS
jgi:hypothetical protein